MPSIATSAPLLNTESLESDLIDDLIVIFQEITKKSNNLALSQNSNLGKHISHEIEQLKIDSGNNDISAYNSKQQQQQHVLILQRSLSPYVNSLINFSDLKQKTQIEKVIWLDEKIDLPTSEYDYNYEDIMHSNRSIVFLCDGSLTQLDNISILLKDKLIPSQNNSHLFSIISTNNYKQSTELYTETLGIQGDIDLYYWDTYGVSVLDSDLISLNLPFSGLRDLYLYDSFESCDKLASYLIKLIVKSNYKMRITNSYLFGSKSEKFYKIFQRLKDQNMNNLPLKLKKIIEDQDETLFMDHHSFFKRNVDLVVLERGCDIVSCLLSQLSYVGLCDELIGIHLNSIEVMNEENNEMMKFKFNSPNDDIYQLIKDLNFSMIGGILNLEAKHLQEQFDSRHRLKDIGQMKQFVEKLGVLKERQKWVKNHTVLAENIVQKVNKGGDDELIMDEELNEVEVPEFNYFNSFIELQQDILGDLMDNKKNCFQICEFIYKYEPKLEDVLKLLILTSIIKKGIREQEYNIFIKEILDTYGIKYLPLMLTLREKNIIYPRESQFFATSSSNNTVQEKSNVQLINDFTNVSKLLNLLPTNTNTNSDTNESDMSKNTPSDADFAYPGYVPIMARLVQSLYDRDYMIPQTKTSSSSNAAIRLKKLGWGGLDQLNTFFNATTHEEFLVPESKKKLFDSVIPPKLSTVGARQDMIIVCCLGGLTYSEASTIRYVLQKNPVTKDKQLLMLTTGMVKGDDFIQAFM